METTLTAGWDNFYVIAGSAAGGLIGLTFVVIALMNDVKGVSSTGFRAFVSPTIVHFSMVLALAAFLSAPHHHLLTLAAGLGASGLGGFAYCLFVARNLGGYGTKYVPVREDWAWNVIVPALVYGALVALSVAVLRGVEGAMYGVGACLLAVLFIGIHNAWDIAVYMTIDRKRDAT